jgi:hypothetical protein
MEAGVKRLVGLVVLALGCTPLTFSKEGEIDFDAYSTVYVSVDAPVLVDGSEYLARELRESSGFERVTTDPGETVRLVLEVDVAVTQRSIANDDGTTDVKYDGDAHFRATTPDGTVVLEGDETDTSESEGEAAEDVLDEVALRFLAPYRI